MALFSVQYYTKDHQAKTKLIHAKDEADAEKSVKRMLRKHKEYWDNDEIFSIVKLESKKKHA